MNSPIYLELTITPPMIINNKFDFDQTNEQLQVNSDPWTFQTTQLTPFQLKPSLFRPPKFGPLLIQTTPIQTPPDSGPPDSDPFRIRPSKPRTILVHVLVF